MYLNNPKKLFDDLYHIPTMCDYMETVLDDGMEDDLANLISIVSCNRNEVHYGGEGSCRWDLEQYDTEEERQQVIKDSRMMNAIYKEIKKELNSKYVVQCMNCGYVWFYSKRSKCITSALESDTNTYSKYKCFCKGTLNVYTFEEWVISENLDIDKLKRWL